MNRNMHVLAAMALLASMPEEKPNQQVFQFRPRRPEPNEDQVLKSPSVGTSEEIAVRALQANYPPGCRIELQDGPRRGDSYHVVDYGGRKPSPPPADLHVRQKLREWGRARGLSLGAIKRDPELLARALKEVRS